MSFLNPLFLLGLAAVVAPIIVHLVRRTNAKRVEFASLMFVRRVPQRTIRRRRLHNLLLLLMRCLALLLLVLAFARPYFSGAGAELGRNNRATVVMLDNSYSMRYGRRFEQAKARAKAIIGESSGERIALVSFGQGYDVLSRFTTETAKLNSLVDGAQAGLGGTDYAQALRGAESLLKEAATKEQRVVLISDFQKAGWNQAEAGFRLGRDVKLVPVDVSEGEAPNLAITDVNAQPVIYQQKYTDKLVARVANHSDEERSGVRVEFQLNDKTVEKREIRIPARDVALVEFTDFNLSDGVNRAMIEASGDANSDKLPIDNRFYFTLRRETQSKALVIEAAVRGRSESLYLRNALTTGDNLPFTLDVKTAGSVNPGELGEYKVIIVNDAGEVSAALAEQLAKFVEKGGGVVIAAGRHTEASSFNQSFKAISPAALGEAVESHADPVSMSEVKTDHPIFELFRQSGRLAMARVYGYHRSTPNEKSSVLARFEDGSPALVEGSYGNGKVLLFTSTLDAGWNDLPLTPTYLPLVRQMVRHLGEREENAWHPLGQPFTAPAAKDGSLPAVDAPGGTRITERTQTATGELIVNAREQGFYRLRYPDRSDFSAVDLDGKESDLSRLDINEFTASVTDGDAKAAQAAAEADGKPGKEELESRQRVWWSLLIASLALFVTEAILARRTKMARVIG
ncbi:MAG TPA: VWA domain-containing protein [Blastocatellia bacterium]|nr:VWA domain-containing protein [Blastocatellia bacterium]